jgi:hypothetical protein
MTSMDTDTQGDMPVVSMSRLSRLSWRLSQKRRRGVAGAIQRATLAVLPAPPVLPGPPRAETAVETAPDLSGIARERARRALVEARRTMSGIIGDEPSAADVFVDDSGAGMMPDFEQLRSYLEESERQRAELREVVADLKEVVRSLQARLDGLERLLPAGGPAAGNGAEPDMLEARDGETAVTSSDVTATASTANADPPAAGEATEGAEAAASPSAPGPPVEGDRDGEAREEQARAVAALRARVFAAGTVGTRVFITPVRDEPELDAILVRLNSEPLVDLAEPIEPDGDTTGIRVTLRAPLRWDQFGAILTRGLEQPLGDDGAVWMHGAVLVGLGGPAAQSVRLADDSGGGLDSTDMPRPDPA